MTFITCAQVPFRIIEHPEFKDLVNVIQLAQSKIDLPSARTARRFLETTVQMKQQNVLDRLPSGSRLSIALDCWTSPFQQAFMAITGYFLDQDWEYREVLLGFEPLHGSHTGSNLSTVVFQILEEHGIAERVLSITTDNATNNNTMMVSVQDTIQSQGLSNASVFRIPCIAHVIQLSLHQLLGKMKVEPVNNRAETEWSDERTYSLHSTRSATDIVDTLNKVQYNILFLFSSFLITYFYYYPRALLISLGPESCYIYKCKPTAAGRFPWLSSQGAEACSCPGRSYTMEFHILNASAG